MAWTAIEPNLYQHTDGRLRAIAQAGRGRRKEKYFPPTTALMFVRNWLERTRVQLRAANSRGAKLEGTLAGDILAYLETLPDGATKNNTRWELTAWVPALGNRRRATITVAHLRLVVKDWLEAEVPASTINHRRRALAQLWETLDGVTAPNPVRGVKRAKEVLGDPKAYPMEILDAILDEMDPARGRLHKGESSFGPRPNLSLARLRMLLWTGMPPSSLMRLQPRQVSFELPARVLSYPPRSKGKGAKTVILPLYPRGEQAVRHWLHAHAWGRFSQGSLRKALQRAAQSWAAQQAAHGRSSPIPVDASGQPDLSPYDLRHSFLTWLYVTEGDPYVVQRYGQHADLATTYRYAHGGIDARILAAVERARQAFAAGPATTATQHIDTTPPHNTFPDSGGTSGHAGAHGRPRLLKKP